jgi:hypothetical protein
MFVEIDEAAVKSSDWEAVLSGDNAAKDRVRAALKGVSCYAHFLSSVEAEERVPLRELHRHGCIDGVTIEVSAFSSTGNPKP